MQENLNKNGKEVLVHQDIEDLKEQKATLISQIQKNQEDLDSANKENIAHQSTIKDLEEKNEKLTSQI